jgi:hypothetical protein
LPRADKFEMFSMDSDWKMDILNSVSDDRGL